MARYQYDFEEERFQQAISQYYKCVICRNVLRDPVMCRENEHLFCRSCITRYLANFKRCPTCMQELSIETLNEAPRIIKNVLSELKIRCDFYKRGCLMFVELGDLAKHCEECEFGPAICSNQGCYVEVNKRDLKYHENVVCERRKVKCFNCADKMDIDGDEKSKVIVAGGSMAVTAVTRGFIELGSVEMFDLCEGTWTLLQPMIKCHDPASAFVYKNHMIVTGHSSNNKENITADCICTGTEALKIGEDIPLSTWENVSIELPCVNKTFVFDDNWIVLGSYHSDYSDCIFEISLIPPFPRKLLASMPDKLSYYGAECFDDKIVKVGGMNVEEDAKDNVSMYDVRMNEYKELTPLPYPVYDMATVKWNDNIIILGGGCNNESFNKVLMYSVKTQKSRMLPPMIKKREGCTAVVVNGSIIVMGGRNENEETLKSVESFDFNSYCWKELPCMHETRWWAASIAC